MRGAPNLIFFVGAFVSVCMSRQLNAALEIKYDMSDYEANDNGLSRLTEKKVFICVTGQLARLELENKVRSIILPLQKAGYKTDLALVLSAGKAKFTNKDKSGDIFDDARSVVSFLSEYPTINFLRDEYFVHDFEEKPGFPQLYAERLYTKKRHSWQGTIERVENHMRIFGSYQKCWDIAEKQRIKSGNSGAIYNAFIRLRDDIGLEDPIDTRLVASLSQPSQDGTKKTMIATDCRSSHGVNDRMALVSPAAAEEYFMRPLQVLLREVNPETTAAEEYPRIDWEMVNNPETFIKTLYEACNITVIQSSKLRGVNRIITGRLANGLIGPVYDPEDLNWRDCPRRPRRETM